MKKAMLWVGVGLGVFVALVGVIFVVLTYLTPGPDQENVVQVPSDETVDSTQYAKQVPIPIGRADSLLTVLGEVRSELLFTQLLADSLEQRILFMDGLVIEYEQTVAELNDIVLEKQVQRSRIKDLAKTYETMKLAEIKPILANVNDETVIALYENMSGRTRKVILNSLSGDRAAAITHQLAGIVSNE